MDRGPRTIELDSLARWVAVAAHTSLVLSVAAIRATAEGDRHAGLLPLLVLFLVDFPSSILSLLLSSFAGTSPESSLFRWTLALTPFALLGGLQCYWISGKLTRFIPGGRRTIAWAPARTWAFVVALVAGMTAIPCGIYVKRYLPVHENAAYPPPQAVFEGDSAALARSIIVPTLDTPMPEGRNVIWCATFQMAWNRLRDDVVGEPIVVENGEAVTERLNRAAFAEDDIPADSRYAAAGRVDEGILETIHREMWQRFQKEPMPLEAAPGDLVAYAFLRTRVPFKHPYLDCPEGLPFTDHRGQTRRVAAFGFWKPEQDLVGRLANQVQLLYVVAGKDQDRPAEFALDLCRFSRPNQVIVACLPPKGSLLATLAELDRKIAEHSSRSEHLEFNGCSLLVPNLNWSIAHRFKELEGEDKWLRNRGFEEIRLGSAVQRIDFRLDRSGVALESEAAIKAAGIPREYRFDRPFLICVKRRGAPRPFFVMWVDNAELLCKRNNDEPPAP